MTASEDAVDIISVRLKIDYEAGHISMSFMSRLRAAAWLAVETSASTPPLGTR